MNLRKPTLVALCCAVSLALAACSDDSESSSGDAGASEAAGSCGAAQQMAASVRSLSDVDLDSVDVEDLERALDGVDDAWSDFEDSIDAGLEPQIDAVNTALENAGSTVATVQADPAVLDGAPQRLPNMVFEIETAWDLLTSEATGQLEGCDLGS